MKHQKALARKSKSPSHTFQYTSVVNKKNLLTQASKNPVLPSLFDGLGMGLGFSMALTMIGALREVLGAGEVFGYAVMPASYVPVSIFVLAPGAFFVLAGLTAVQNYIKIQGEKKGKDMSKIQSGCNCDCLNCGDQGCNQRKEEAKQAENSVEVSVQKENAQEGGTEV